MAKAKPAGSRRKAVAGEPDIREFEAFIYREVRLLDERRFEDWMELFTEDGYYWAPALPDQESPMTNVSLFYDDRAAMGARFARLRHPRVYAQIPHSRSCHLVGNVTLEEADLKADAYRVQASFLMLEYRPGSEQRVFGGRYEYRLRRLADTLKIESKRATIVNCDASFRLMAIPF